MKGLEALEAARLDVKIPESVTDIRYFAFSGCSALEIRFPGALKQLDDCAFCKCSSLRSIVAGP